MGARGAGALEAVSREWAVQRAGCQPLLSGLGERGSVAAGTWLPSETPQPVGRQCGEAVPVGSMGVRELWQARWCRARERPRPAPAALRSQLLSLP